MLKKILLKDNEKYFAQVMDNGNLILPPFRASDYKQEVHAQVSLLLFTFVIFIIIAIIAIAIIFLITTILRHTVVSRRMSWERFSLGMFMCEQVQSTFLLAMHTTDMDFAGH